MNLGFTFRETMRGTYYLLSNPTLERPMAFTVDVRGEGLRAFAQTPVARMEGSVTLDGFVEAARLDGTLAFRIHDQRRLVYDFTFKDDGGHLHRFRGQKDITPLALVESFTTLPGTLYEGTTSEIGRATLYFDLRSDLRKLLRSFRVVA